MLRCASAVSVPVEARLSMRPFALRQRRLTLRSVPAAGSTLLACIFEAIPEIFAWPVRSPSSRPRSGFFIASRGTINARNPLPGPTSELPRLYSDLRSPPGSLDPSGSKRSARFQRGSLPLRVARSSFAPRRAQIIYLSLRATDHRSRSATSRQARCPSNLLEPYSSCTRMSFRSTKKQTRYGALNRKYLTWNEAVTTTLA